MVGYLYCFRLDLQLLVLPQPPAYSFKQTALAVALSTGFIGAAILVAGALMLGFLLWRQVPLNSFTCFTSQGNYNYQTNYFATSSYRKSITEYRWRRFCYYSPFFSNKRVAQYC